MEVIQVKQLLISAQDDMLRMMVNSQTQHQAEKAIGNEYAAGFHGGNKIALYYACKHITNILEEIDKLTAIG